MANNSGRINFDVGFNINKTQINALKADLQQLNQMTLNDFMNRNSTLNITEARKQFQALKKDIADIQNALSTAFNNNLGSTNITKLNHELQQLDLKRIYTNFQTAGAAGTAAFNSISSATLKTNLQLRQSHKLLDEMAISLKNSVKWAATSSIVNRMADSIQAAWTFTKGLDTDLNDIRIVTNKSADEMERFARQANKAAQSLGAATRDYTQASLIFYQQGLSDEEVNARTNVTLKAANVTGQQASEVSEQLTAVWNGYRVNAEETEAYVDKLAAVGANTASNLEELSTAMSKVASAANTAGVPIDNLNAILSTVISVTREAPETIGTAFKTIFARLGDLSLGGTDEEGIGLGNVSSKLKALGVDVLDINGDMRQMSEIITDVAAKWNTWTQAQKQAAAVAMAGKMQYSRLISLFENWDMYTDALNTSQNALGTLQEQQDIYMESTAAHLQKLQSAWDRVSNAMVNNEGINSVIDAFANAVTGIGNFVEAIGDGGTALLGLGSIAMNVFSRQIGQGLNSMIQNMQASKYNAEQLRLQLEALKMQDNAWTKRDSKGQEISYDAGTRSRLEDRQRMESYIGSLNESQMKQGFDLFDELGKAKSELQQYEQNQKDAAQYIRDTMKQNGYNWSNQDAKNALVDQSSRHMAYVDQWTVADEQMKKYKMSIEDLKNAQEDVQKAIVNTKKKTEDYNVTLEQSNNKISDLTRQQNEQKNSLKTLEEERDKLNRQLNVVQDVTGIINRKVNNGENLNSEEQEYLDNSLQKQQNFADKIKIIEEEIKQKKQETTAFLTESDKQIQKSKNEVINSERKQERAIKQEEDSYRHLKKEVINLISTLNELQERKDIGEKEKQQLKEVLQELKAINLETANLNSDEIQALFTRAAQAAEGAFNEVDRRTRVITQAIAANSSDAYEIIQRRVQDATIAVENFHQTMSRTSTLDSLTKLVGGFGNLATAAMTISNLGNIFNNDDLSTWEKFLQIVMNLGLAIPMVITGITELRANFSALTTLTKGYIVQLAAKTLLEKQGIAVTQESIRQKMIEITATQTSTRENIKNAASQLLKHKYLLLIAAAAAVAGVAIYAIVKAYNAEADAAKEANARAEDAAKTYTELNTATQTLKSTISDYSKGIEELNKLTKGTEEYKTALEEANDKAKKLIETYKLYDQYTYKDGAIIINDQALKTAQNELETRKMLSENYKYATQIAADEANNVNQLTKLRRSIGNLTTTETKGTTAEGKTFEPAEGRQLSNDSILSIINGLNAIRERSQDAYDLATNSDEQLKETILSIAETNPAIQTAIDQIMKQKTALMTLTESYYDASKKMDYYVSEILRTTIGEKFKDQIKLLATDANDEVDETRASQIENIAKELSISGKRAQELTKDGLNAYMNPDLINSKNWGHVNGNNTLNKVLTKVYGLDEKQWKIDNDEDLIKTYAREVKQMTDDEINKLTYKSGAWSRKLVDSSGKAIIDANDAEMRAAIYQQAASQKINKNVAEGLTEEDILKPIENLMNSAKQAGYKYGTDFTDAMLNALADKDSKFDFSSVFNRLDPNEVNEMISMSGEELRQFFGITDEVINKIGVEKGQALLNGIRQGLEDYSWNIDDHITASINKLSEDFKTYGADLSKKKLEELQDDVKIYAKNLMEIAENENEVSEAMKYNSDAAVEFAFRIVKMNKAIDTLADNMENWIDIIKHSTETSQEYAEAMYGIEEAIADVYGIEAKYISQNFIKEHLSEIQQIATGSETAIEGLRDALSEELLVNIMVANEKQLLDTQDNILTSFKTTRQQIEEVMTGIKVGDSIDDSDLITALNRIIQNTHMTVAQANEMFSALKLEPKYATDIVEQEQVIPRTTTRHQIKNVHLEGLTPTWETVDEVIEEEPVRTTHKIPITAISADGTQPKISGITKAPGGSFNNYSSVNKGGKAPGKTSKSGSSKNPDKQDYLKDQKDFYHDINLELKNYETELNRLQKAQEKLFGQDLIENYNEQLENLNKTIDATNRKIEIARGEMKLVGDYLAERGVMFDADGYISNYTQIYEDKLRATNGIIDAYNKMSAEEQENYKDAVETAKKDFDEFVENINRYDEIVSDLIPGLIDDIQEAQDKQIEISISKFNMAIELELDTAKLEKDWAKFQRRIIKDITDKNFGYIVDKAKDMLETEFKIFYDENNSGVVQDLTQHVLDTQRELEKIRAEGWSEVYGDNAQQALEDLKNYHSELMNQMEEYQDMIDEIRNSFGELMDEAAGRIEEQIDLYGQLRNMITHDMSMIKILYGEDSYEALAPYYEQMQQQYVKELQFQKDQVKLYEDAMNAAEQYYGRESQEWRDAREMYINALGAWDQKTEEATQNAIDKYVNAIDLIFQNLENKITRGAGLEYVSEEWELINKSSDMYLDNLNAMYEVQKLATKYQDAFDQTSSLSAQKAIKELQESELKDLRERDKLTKYDIDRANLKYELMLRQIALEEAQQNKSSLRLRRDSQGNYTYQYVADEDAVKKAEQELGDVYNELYNLDKDKYKNNLDQAYTIYEEFHQKMRDLAANTTMDTEEKERWKALYVEQYGQMINDLLGENELIRQNLRESALAHHMYIMDTDRETFEQMTDAETQDLINKFIDTANPNSILSTHQEAFATVIDLQGQMEQNFEKMDNNMVDHAMNILAPGWHSAVQLMISDIKNEGGFEPVVLQAIANVDEKMIQYGNDVATVSENSRNSFQDLKNNGLDPTIESTDNLISATDGVIGQYDILLHKMADSGGVLDVLNQLTERFNSNATAARNAANAAYEYITAVNQKAEADARYAEQQARLAKANVSKNVQYDSRVPSSSSNGNSSGSGGDNGTTSAGGGGSNTLANATQGLLNTTTNANNTRTSGTKGEAVHFKNNKQFGLALTPNGRGVSTRYGNSGPTWYVSEISNGAYPVGLGSRNANTTTLKWIKWGALEGFTGTALKTGGYTGDWADDSGKLAILHKKELVLNASDTENILAAVDAIRSITLGQLSPRQSMMADIAAAAQSMEQNVHIDATFPNVRDASEIEAALNNLTNRASQYANRKENY